MAGLYSNLDLFMKLRSFKDLKNWETLSECIISKIPNPLCEEDVLVIEEFCQSFVKIIAAKWQKSHRILSKFLKKQEVWLQEEVAWPDCQNINLREIFGEIEYEQLATPYPEMFGQIEDEELTAPNLEVPSLSDSSPRQFMDLSDRQRKRRSGSITDNHSEKELLYFLCHKLKENGKKALAKAVKEMVETNEVKKKNSVEDDKALALCTALSLSKWQYLILRSFLKKECECVLPSYHNILSARKRCYPAEDLIEITEKGASVRLQALLDHTSHRIKQSLNNIGEEELKLIWKWGLDGSSSQSNYKQKFSEPEFDDSSVVMTSAVPLRLITHAGAIVWENPCPGSTSYCRPIKFHFQKETADIIKEINSDIKDQIERLVPSQIGGCLVTHELHMTMIDGKVSNTIANVPSSATCPICLSKPSEMNNLELVDSKPVREEIYNHGLSSLHMKIRCMECLLHISYNMDFERWAARGPFKLLKEAKKAETQKEFRKHTGLVKDVVKQGFGTTNDDGNTARRFFEKFEMSSQITGIDINLIFRFSVILQTISSGKKINVEEFRKYCRVTAELYVQLYDWYHMPASVHKLLMHGADICNSFSNLPIGIMSEEASEARNKDFRNLRETRTRKMSRISTNADILHGLLITSDPYIGCPRAIYTT